MVSYMSTGPASSSALVLSSSSGLHLLASPFGDTTYTKVFVGGLAWETTSDRLWRFYERFGDILEAVVITDRHSGRSKGYEFVVVIILEAGMLKEAISLLHEMEKDGIQPDVVSTSTLLTACGRCRQITKIDTNLAAAKSRGIELNTIVYNSGIGSYLSFGDYEKALELYTLMRVSNVKPDAVTYNILISGSCKLGKYAESLKFFEDVMDLRIPLTKELYSSLICSYVKQGKLTEAESTFSSMKESGCFPDVLTYTAMIQAYNDDGSWRSAWDLFKEMEGNDIQPDAIICSSLMEALNKGSSPERVLQLMEFMKENRIPLNQKAYFEIMASCSMLRDWKTASEIIEHFDSSLSSISVGTLNHLLNFLGKCGKTDSMMKLFYKMVTSCSTVGLSTYMVLLRNLLAVGKWRSYTTYGTEYIYPQGTLNPYVGKQYVPIYVVSATTNTANEPFSQLSTSISGGGNGYVAVHGYNVPGNQYMQFTGSNFNNTSPTPRPTIQAPFLVDLSIHKLFSTCADLHRTVYTHAKVKGIHNFWLIAALDIWTCFVIAYASFLTEWL